MLKNTINEKNFHCHTYTSSSVSEIDKSQRIKRKASNCLSVSIKNSRIKMSVRSSTSIEMDKTNPSRNSKFVTIEFSIKKRNPNNLCNNVSSTSINLNGISNLFDRFNSCDCQMIENYVDNEFRNNKQFLNSNDYVLSFKKYLVLSTMILISIFGLTTSLIFLIQSTNTT
jgi:hypothetical protein